MTQVLDNLATSSNGPHRFTSADAAEMALLSWQRRRERAAMLADAEPTEQPSQQDAGYTAQQLTRVREHLARLDAQLEATKDPQAIERLVRARGVLGEQERILAGRPLPGSRRPGREKPVLVAPVKPLD